MLSRRLDHHRHLLTGSAVLVVGAGVQALFGAIYWLLAARGDTAADVGDATALFTSVLFVTYVAGLGLPVALARYAPDQSDDSRAITGWSLAATAVASALGALVYLAVVRTDATEALSDWHPIFGPLLFVALTIGAVWSLLIDVRWMTVRRWGLVLARFAVIGFVRLPLLALPVDGNRVVFLFVVAMGPAALSGVVGAISLGHLTGAPARLRPRPTTARAAARYSLVNWLSTLAHQGPQFALPVIVLANVSSESNASFYIAWGVTAIGMYVPLAIGQALLAEGGKDGVALASQVRIALLLAVGLMVVATAMTAVGRDLLVSVYGDDYRDGARILPWLVAATIPWAVTSVYLTEARVQHRNMATVAITTTLTVGTLVPALLLVPDEGLDGARNALLIGNVLAAVVAGAAHHAGRHPDAPWRRRAVRAPLVHEATA